MRSLRLLSGVLVICVALCGFLWWMILWTPGPDTACRPSDSMRPELATRLSRHITYLASDIGPRASGQSRELEATASYIEREFRQQGWSTQRQYTGPEDWHFNVVAQAERPASRDLLVIGAHYDTVPDSPGADDNASGVAALLEIARALPKDPRLRLIAFTNEEAPLGYTEFQGSRVAASTAAARGETLQGMLCLESIGYFSDRDGSQQRPTLFGRFFPDRGNFLLMVSDLRSRAFLHRLIAGFRATSTVPAEGISVPTDRIEHVRRSDHAPFWDNGYPAIMVTDTAQFRNPNYHRASDIVTTVDIERLADVTAGLASALQCRLAQ
jgi:Peptidase family M28